MANIETVFMFSGQGSQYFQMGRALFDHDRVFRDYMTKLDGIVRELSGHSVVDVLYYDKRDKDDVFNRTLFSHPAIFMVECALAQCLIRSGVTPSIVLGASLGSFAASAVADFVDVEDALTAVMRHAATLETCCEPGGMLAILADPAFFAEDFLAANSELAAVNFSSHFVIAAPLTKFEAIESRLRSRGVTYQRLPVSFAFHSRWIDAAQAPFESFLRSIRVKTGKIPLMCCDEAALITDLPDNYFWRVARRPIRFRDAIEKLERQRACRFIDVGPAGTLATFLKYSLPPASKSSIHSILSPFGHDQRNLTALLAAGRH